MFAILGSEVTEVFLEPSKLTILATVMVRLLTVLEVLMAFKCIHGTCEVHRPSD